MKKSQKIEMKIYELLGVKQFKKATFILEKIVHRKDKGKNINYHIKNSFNIESVKEFKKFLYYNGTIHVKNIIIKSVFLIVPLILIKNQIMVIVMLLSMIKDTYCVMLQRYNWLKLNDFEEKLIVRENKRIFKKTEEIDSKELERQLINKQVNKKELIENLQIIRNYLIKEKSEREPMKTSEINSSIGFIEEIVNNEVSKKQQRKKLIKEKNYKGEVNI